MAPLGQATSPPLGDLPYSLMPQLSSPGCGFPIPLASATGHVPHRWSSQPQRARFPSYPGLRGAIIRKNKVQHSFLSRKALHYSRLDGNNLFLKVPHLTVAQQAEQWRGKGTISSLLSPVSSSLSPAASSIEEEGCGRRWGRQQSLRAPEYSTDPCSLAHPSNWIFS